MEARGIAHGHKGRIRKHASAFLAVSYGRIFWGVKNTSNFTDLGGFFLLFFFKVMLPIVALKRRF